MALGLFRANSAITTNTDTAVAAAPGAGQAIHVIWIGISVLTGGTGSRLIVEDGAGGNVLARMATTSADAELFRNYATGIRLLPGRQLSDNTALNIETTGSGAASVEVDVVYEVKGG